MGHIAFIMDGNGRWARKRLLPRSAGHKEGLKTIERVTEFAQKNGIKVVSFFAFSTENWQRPQKEVDSLMKLMKQNLPKMSKRITDLGAKLVFSGNIDAFDDDLRDIILKYGSKNIEKDDSVINICLNYGGRSEIVNAVNEAVKKGKMIDETEFSALLYTKNLPDPDLLIRTGGEMRISNFMLYQLAYTEFYFSDKLWPDFNENDFSLALEDYNKRQRKFGKV